MAVCMLRVCLYVYFISHLYQFENEDLLNLTLNRICFWFVEYYIYIYPLIDDISKQVWLLISPSHTHIRVCLINPTFVGGICALSNYLTDWKKSNLSLKYFLIGIFFYILFHSLYIYIF